MELKLEWELSNEPLADIGFAIAKTATQIVHEQLSDLAELFPFKGNWELQGHRDDHLIIVRITERLGSGVPSIGKLNDEEISFICDKVLPFTHRTHLELSKLLGTPWFSFSRFTYVGPYNHPYACWPDLNQHLMDWLNNLVLPEVLRRNEARVLRAIPKPPQFDLETIRQACWVLECEQSCKQGTAFNLEGVGLITCQHVLGPETIAFHPSVVSKKYKIEVLAENNTIDLAILNIGTQISTVLAKGTADTLKQMDHIAIAGFPNYRLGDSGVIVPGLVVGFRMVSGIRRILTNAPIVAGTSGGPVIAAGNKVIGIAVTGAERMEDSQETENHGIIPIDALTFLQ